MLERDFGIVNFVCDSIKCCLALWTLSPKCSKWMFAPVSFVISTLDILPACFPAFLNQLASTAAANLMILFCPLICSQSWWNPKSNAFHCSRVFACSSSWTTSQHVGHWLQSCFHSVFVQTFWLGFSMHFSDSRDQSCFLFLLFILCLLLPECWMGCQAPKSYFKKFHQNWSWTWGSSNLARPNGRRADPIFEICATQPSFLFFRVSTMTVDGVERDERTYSYW